MDPFLGELRLFPWNFAPRGWALCQGQILSIQSSTALFSLLGTQYGGNGTTTFGLPDLRGRAAVHFGSSYVQGEAIGEETHVLTLSEMPMHTHTLMGTSQTGDGVQPNGNAYASVTPTTDAKYAAGGTLTPLNAMAVQFQGGSQGHANMQPYLVLNYCIATQGLYPSRN